MGECGEEGIGEGGGGEKEELDEGSEVVVAMIAEVALLLKFTFLLYWHSPRNSIFSIGIYGHFRELLSLFRKSGVSNIFETPLAAPRLKYRCRLKMRWTDMERY